MIFTGAESTADTATNRFDGEGDCCDQDVYDDSRVHRVTRMPLLAVGPFGLSENHGATE